ncbi:MAG: hypothetical protein LBN22_03765 [Clostridiales Family XIII bacterium]|jgi:adenine/guanine phosphoribosyltransferase-like PRPP-binding protein|nr:hypothetical protein [Clostridiales Family XIII bacterium]
MAIANGINVPLTSISDFKKAPMSVFSISKDTGSAVYVLKISKRDY